MDFGQAIREMKAGRVVYRESWNGKDMYLDLFEPPHEDSLDTRVMTMPFITITTTYSGYNRVPWMASHDDMLSEDWEVLI